jgi:hypothetical protein
MGSVFDGMDLLPLAEQIISLGGRTTSVEAILGIEKKDASRMYKYLTRKPSKGGLLPWDPLWVVKTPQNCLHSSYFIKIYQELMAGHNDPGLQPDKRSVFVAAYALYQSVVDGGTYLEIDRAWHIVMQYANQSIFIKKCVRCDNSHIAHRNYPELFQLCPLCDVGVDIRHRKRWLHKTY